MQREKIRAALLAAVLGCGSSEALLAAECKGLEQSLCEARTDCRWIAPYERKDGIKVSGYCRIKGVKPATETPQPPAASAPPPASGEAIPPAPVLLEKPAAE